MKVSWDKAQRPQKGDLMSEAREFDQRLKTYAVRHDNTQGRQFKESGARDRNEFQRDCSRIIHSSAFRRLQYKTQVFANHEGDLFRTRLSHSLEVAQISRSVARSLYLNEDLAETLALAHDLGHAPFGHLGQQVLNELLVDHGGFEHNLQSLRIVDELEKPYLEYNGLNLLFETREGILKHCSVSDAHQLGHVAQRFLPLNEGGSPFYQAPSLEAQLTDLCDAIAYTHADLEDGIRQNILNIEQVESGLPRFAKHMALLRKQYGKIQKGDENRYVRVATGIMIKEALQDLVQYSEKTIANSGIVTLDDVKAQDKMIAFSPEFKSEQHLPFKQFLRKELYQHPDVDRNRIQQKELLKQVFYSVLKAPAKWIEDFNPKDARGTPRQVADYISGMTDRYAITMSDKILEDAGNRNIRLRGPKK